MDVSRDRVDFWGGGLGHYLPFEFHAQKKKHCIPGEKSKDIPNPGKSPMRVGLLYGLPLYSF